MLSSTAIVDNLMLHSVRSADDVDLPDGSGTKKKAKRLGIFPLTRFSLLYRLAGRPLSLYTRGNDRSADNTVRAIY